MSGPHPLASLINSLDLRGARTLQVDPDGLIEIVRVPLGLPFETAYLGVGGRSARLDPPALRGQVVAPGLLLLWSSGAPNRAPFHLLGARLETSEPIGGTAAIMRTHRMRVVDLADRELLWLTALLGGYQPDKERP